LRQAVNMFFFFFCKVGHFNMGVYGIESLLHPVSSGQSMNCSLSQFKRRDHKVAAWWTKVVVVQSNGKTSAVWAAHHSVFCLFLVLKLLKIFLQCCTLTSSHSSVCFFLSRHNQYDLAQWGHVRATAHNVPSSLSFAHDISTPQCQNNFHLRQVTAPQEMWCLFLKYRLKNTFNLLSKIIGRKMRGCLSAMLNIF